MTTKNRSGMVAIMVTAMIMVILSLITLGFARLVSREQRQALDDQLSTQAFYAAESGVNAAAAKMRGGVLAEKNDCDVSTYNNGTIDSATPEVRFTCLMIDPTPTELKFNNGFIKTDRARVVPVFTNPLATELNFRWSDNNPARVNAGADCDVRRIPALNQWGDDRVAMLEVDLIPFPNAATGNLNREFLDQNTATFLFYPCGDSSASVTTVNYTNFRAGDASGSRRGNIQAVFCDKSGGYTCSVTVNGFPAMNYYARIKSIYSSANVEVAGKSGTNVVSFANAQVVVDSTGRANDVLRRVQVRLPFESQALKPEASLQSKDEICKLYSVTGTTVENGCN
jgi:hypothetical protein